MCGIGLFLSSWGVIMKVPLSNKKKFLLRGYKYVIQSKYTHGCNLLYELIVSKIQESFSFCVHHTVCFKSNKLLAKIIA